jgi:myo-inositol-1(or 4)-monophosphatase
LPAAEGSLADDAGLLQRAVRVAGELGLTLFRQGVNSWKKGDGSVVTEADLEIDAYLRRELLGQRPDYGWLSEETPDTEERLAREMVWVVDPIDGTRAFANAGNEWCVTAALLRKGRPVAATVYRPMTEDFFSAGEGTGSLCNGLSLRVTDGIAIAGSRVIGNRRATGPLEVAGAEPLRNLEIPLLLRLALVAAGEIDAAVSTGHKNDWDLAAGALLVQEAGGCVTDLTGATMVFNQAQAFQRGLLAAGPNRHALLLEHVRIP